MVRLKVVNANPNWDRKEISIPYGAIKRQPQFAVLSAFFYISIPYGAIKRNECGCN